MLILSRDYFVASGITAVRAKRRALQRRVQKTKCSIQDDGVLTAINIYYGVIGANRILQYTCFS